MDWLNRLKEMKRSCGLTTKEIANGSGIPEPTLEKLFSGATKDPKLNTMRQLVHFMGFSLDDLAPIEKEKTSASEEPEAEASEIGILFYQQLIAAGYLREGEDFTDAQVQILSAVISILDATFPKRAIPENNESRKIG